MPDERPARRAAVVSRHPATLRSATQALGVVGLGLRQVVSPALLPRSQRGEFEVVLLDLDIDPHAPPLGMLQSVAASCPDSPIVCMAGQAPRQRLIEALAHPAVVGLQPKLGSWLESTPEKSGDGPDEQELAAALRRLATAAPIPQGPSPHVLGGATIEEHLISSPEEKDVALHALLGLAQRLGLSEEKLRRTEVAGDELLMNAIVDAPRASGRTLRQVRLRFGSDGRNLALSVHDKFGSLTRDAVVGHLARALEPGGPRPRPAGASHTGGAGLGLVLAFGAANQLVFQVAAGKFTEVTAVIHVAGSNRTSLARGTSVFLHL